MMDDDQQFCLRWNNHQSTLISVFDNLLTSQTLVDCTIAAEGKFLKAHKVVLSACSPYFASLLQQQYDKHPILILKDVKYQELTAMMDYMYRGEVNISQDQLAALLKAAESLQIKGLSDNRTGAPKPEHHRGLNIPGSVGGGSKLSSGYTLEQTKRARVGQSGMDSQDLSASREGSSSPSRRRRKVRRRSIENAMTDIHDNSNSSQMQSNQSALLQQPANLVGAGAITAAAAQIPTSSTALSTGTSVGATGATSGQGSTQQSMTASVTKKTESVKGTSDAMKTENVQTSNIVGVDEQEIENIKGDKQNHKQKMTPTVATGKDTSDLVIEPKSEYDDDGNDETVEDLTLDDEEMGMDDLDHNAGTSQGGEGSSQGYAPWQHDRSQDELLLTTQDAQQRDPQGTTDGYWTILETVPYSIQSTNTATTISNVVSGSQQHLSEQHAHIQHIQEQQLHQQHVSTSTDPANLITSATVVVEIPSESMGGLPGSTIQYTIPKTESHQLLRTATVGPNINKIHHNQRIQHITQQRLISNAPNQTTSPAVQSQQQTQQQHQQHDTHHQHMQQLALQDCLDTNLVTHELQHQSQQQQTTQTHPEYIKINANRLEEKVLLRNVVQYETTSTNVGDTIVIENPKINLHQQSSQQQQQHRHQQHHHQQQDSNIEEHILLTEHVVNEVVTNESDIKQISADTELGVEIEKALFRQRPKLATSRSTTVDTTPVGSENEFVNNSDSIVGGVQWQYVCNVCGKSYKIKGSLKRHKSYECGVAPTLSCPYCPHKCKYKSDLRKHITQKHASNSTCNNSEILGIQEIA